jgi:hypothetical protein
MYQIITATRRIRPRYASFLLRFHALWPCTKQEVISEDPSPASTPYYIAIQILLLAWILNCMSKHVDISTLQQCSDERLLRVCRDRGSYSVYCNPFYFLSFAQGQIHPAKLKIVILSALLFSLSALSLVNISNRSHITCRLNGTRSSIYEQFLSVKRNRGKVFQIL